MFSRKSFRLLAIGNSFSDNALNYIYPVLKAFGVRQITIGNLYIGGCSVETHWQNAQSDAPAYVYRKNTASAFVSTEGVKMSFALRDEPWQFVTMQQASHFSGDIDTYDEKIDDLAHYVLQRTQSKPILAWHSTWAYQQNSTHPAFVNYGNSQKIMFDRILQCVQTRILSNKLFDTIIPVGTAIQNARTSYLGDTLTADGFHLEGLGELIAAVTYVLALTGWDVSEINPDKLPSRFVPYWDIVSESAVNAIRQPFKVTQSRYIVDPKSTIRRTEYTITTNVCYSEASDACKLDIYAPKGERSATIVQLHGGGLTGGSKSDVCYVAMGKELASRGVCFVVVDYRLFPEAQTDEFFSDCAAALAYVKKHVLQSSEQLFVSGQSAGAYIAMMLAFDDRHLRHAGMCVTDVDGWVFESGQPTTHFELLRRRGVGDWSVAQRIDEFAPLFYVRSSMQFRNALILAYSDDIPNRLEQNKLLYAALVNCGLAHEVRFEQLYGQHVEASTVCYRDSYAYVELLLRFISETTAS